MSKIECTAVNELIDLVQRKPLERDSEEELLFSAPPSARQPRGTQPPPLFSTQGPVFPIDAPAIPAQTMPAAAAPKPLFPVEVSTEPTEARATMPKIWTRQPEFEPTPREDELETVYVAKQVPVPQLLKKLAIPMAAVLVGGIAIGGVIRLVHRTHDSQVTHVSAPSPFVAPALAAVTPPPAPPPAPKVEPIVEKVAAAAPEPAKPKLVDIRLESDPPGASAMLLDADGASTPLGLTPVDASVDPSKSYDVVFTLAGRPSKIEHLDPSATQHLEVALEAPPPPAPVAKAERKHHHHAAKPAARIARADRAAPKAAAPKADTAAESPADKAFAALADKKAAAPKKGEPATGTLAIATTPPCAILIDGQNSGLTTPQKAIPLAAGHHSVRLIAATAHVNKLVAVDIEPRHTTKLVQDFTK